VKGYGEGGEASLRTCVVSKLFANSYVGIFDI
jgi:hypothetical protein